MLECMIDRDLQIKEKEHKMLMEMKVLLLYVLIMREQNLTDSLVYLG